MVCKVGSVFVGGVVACVVFIFCRSRGVGLCVVSWGIYVFLIVGEFVGGIFIVFIVFVFVVDVNVEELLFAIY